jgi:hypothetical protein
MSDNGHTERVLTDRPAENDDAADTTRSVVGARIVLVGPTSGPGIPEVIDELRQADLGPISIAAGVPSSPDDPLWALAQPHQLWILTADDAAAAPLTDLGTTVVRVADGDDIRRAVLSWAAARCRSSEATERSLLRENTILRRELNRALSALGPTHQVLGLMPSVTIDQFRAERRPTTALHPDDPNALMSRRWNPNPAVDVHGLEQEIADLRGHLAAIEQTRVMRWSRLPRSVYRRMRP